MIGPYREVLRQPHAARLAGLTLVYGLAAVSTFVPLVFFARDATGSFAGASAVLAADAIGQAVAGPWRGRMVDRRGPRRTLPLFALGAALAFAALIALGEAGAPLVALVPAAFLAGTLLQTPGVVLRSIWGRVTAGTERSTSFAFLTVTHEITNLIGPILGAGLLVVMSPVAALSGGVAVASISGVLFARSPGVEGGEPEHRHARARFGPLASPGFRAVLAMALFYGLTFGQLEDIAIPAFAVEHGSRASAGILLAAIALGIGVGGFAYGLRTWTRPAGELMPAVSAIALAGTLPLLIGESIVSMTVLLLVFGLAMAPISTLQFAVIDDVAPAGSGTEAFGWLSSVALLGSAAGALIAGKVVDAHGPDTALLGVVAAAAASFLVCVIARRPLAVRVRPVPS